MSASIASIHQCLEPGVAQETYSRQPPSGRRSTTGRSKDSAPKSSRQHLADGLEADAVGAAGHHGRDAAPLGDRSADAVGQPHLTVDERRAGGARPVARPGGRGGDHDLGAVDVGEGEDVDRHGLSLLN